MASASYPLLSATHEGAQFSRTNADWRWWDRDPNTDWQTDARRLAARAWDLVRNDPVMAALLHSRISGTHGNAGLRLRSLYAEDDHNETSETESCTRRDIEGVIARVSAGVQLDASGMMTRNELEEALDQMAAVSGECFAIRCYIADRPRAEYGTCWRLIRPERVSNPPGFIDSDKLYQGISLEDGRPTGIWVGPPISYGLNTLADGKTHDKKKAGWTYVPWYDEDGAPSVIRRTGLMYPGAFRGVSAFTSNMVMAKQTKGLLDAYVVAKRIQACHPIFIEVDDPIEAAKKDKNGAVYGPNTTIEPGKIYYVGRGGKVNFPTWQFNGADMREFLDTLYRNQFAAWGMPIDVVLAQLGNTNMAASRSAWLQYYRQCERWQDDHIAQVTSVIDESIVREAIARGDVKIPADLPWNKVMASRYVRPPKAMPDPLKEALAVAEWEKLGRDPTGLWAESGIDFRESTMQRAEDDKLREAQGVQSSEQKEQAAAMATAKPAPGDADKPDKSDEKPAAKTETIVFNQAHAEPTPVLVNVDIPTARKPIRFDTVRDENNRLSGLTPVYE